MLEQQKSPQHHQSNAHSQQQAQHVVPAQANQSMKQAEASAQHQQQKQSTNNGSAQSKPAAMQTVVNVQPQKPTMTVATVQPQTNVTQSSISQSISNVTSAILQKAPSLPSRTTASEPPKGKLPQLPPRVQSQSSTEKAPASRGPPPAIPPRNNMAAPMRASSIQVTSASALNRPALTRQTSANSIPPQCTPQSAVKFVIPQRQSSRTSLSRSGSISGPSSHD